MKAVVKISGKQYIVSEKESLLVDLLPEGTKERPDGFVQCGIAEQNQVEVAAALANEGFCVFAPSYAIFITSRVLDQLRVNLGIMASPVALVGVSCGCDSAVLGASHMALEDIGCTRQVPGVTVVCRRQVGRASCRERV